MREISIPEKIPETARTISGIISNKLPIKATCIECDTDLKVDLKTLQQVMGDRYSLINQPGSCRVYGCSGKVYFSYYPVGGEEWVPLLTRDFIRGV